MTATRKFTRVPLANGESVDVPTTLLARFRGIDAEGHIVVAPEPEDAFLLDDGSEFLYGLTKCCYASAKGCEHGIACRACYELCSPFLGGPAEVAVARAPEQTHAYHLVAEYRGARPGYAVCDAEQAVVKWFPAEKVADARGMVSAS